LSGAPLAGLVVGSHGRHVMVRADDGRRVRCHLRSRKSEAVVGDRVQWSRSGDEGVIDAVAPRRNLLHRQDIWRSKSFAANLDSLLVLLAVEPPYAETQLARALIAAASAGVPAWIGLNKAELAGIEQARQRLRPYAAMGVEVVELSLKAHPEQSAAALRPRLAGRTTLVLGPSGMGKSTLVNLMVPQAGAAVGEISSALNTGRHTTTTTTWHALGEKLAAGALIDSPGFQAFGLHHVAPSELARLMPDLAAHAHGCRFANCSHRHEPGCAVQAAVQRGEIAATRLRLHAELFSELSGERLSAGA
jgi:ribosome biogenesis GTPase